MNDISFKRILRWTLACLIVFTMFALSFGVGIASAETGSLIIEQASGNSWINEGAGAGDGLNFNWSRFGFDVMNYTHIQKIEVALESGWTIPSDAGSSSFVISSGGNGSGTVVLSKPDRKVIYYFSSPTRITDSSVSLTISNSSFLTSLVAHPTFGVQKNSWSVSITNPVLFYGSTVLSKCTTTADYGCYFTVQTSKYFQNNYTTSYSEGLVNVTIDKTIAGATTSRIKITNDSSIKFDEGAYDITGFSYSFPYDTGLALNMTDAAGNYDYRIVNSTNSVFPENIIIPPPVVDPITGVGIQFDAATYSLGAIANISWIRTISTPFLATDYIMLIRPDGTEEQLTTSPPDTGYTKVLMSPSGTYGVEFRRNTLGFVEVLNSDTAIVGAETPSYIYAPAQVAIGKPFNVTYKIGWVVTSGSTAWIRAYHWDDDTNQWEGTYQPFSATGATGTETNASIIVTKQGKYLIKLCDVLSGCKASAQTEAHFNGSEITKNISFSNISTDKTSYSYGETMLVKTSVDNFNWSNKQIVVEYYDADEGLTQNQQYIQNQVESFPLYISDLTFSGSGAALMRLVGKNDSGTYILNYTAFTLSSTDTEGYGLAVLGSPNCTGDIGQIKAVVPPGETANLSISADNAKYNKDYVINGTRTVPYTFKEAGTYYITVRKSGEAKRLIIITIAACIPVVTDTPISGATQASQVASMLTSSIFWSLIVTAGLMIAIAWRTEDGFATGIIGMLSAGVFTWISWLPIAIFFSVLIIAALLLAGSVVAKQMKAG